MKLLPTVHALGAPRKLLMDSYHPTIKTTCPERASLPGLNYLLPVHECLGSTAGKSSAPAAPHIT